MTDEFASMPMRDLKKEASARGIDVTGFDKPSMLRVLRNHVNGANAKQPAGSHQGYSPAPANASFQGAPPDAQMAAGVDTTAPAAASTPSGGVAGTQGTPAAAPNSGPKVGSGQAANATEGDGGSNEPGNTAADLKKCSVKQLKEMAASKGIDTAACIDKDDLVDKISRGPTATKGFVTKSAAKKAPAPAAAKKTSPTWVPPSEQAKRKEEELKAAKEAAKVAAEKLKADLEAEARKPKVEKPAYIWSAKMQRCMDNYPGFEGTLIPEMETWAETELDMYFGSNGDIWPMNRGKRPTWVTKPNAKFAPDEGATPKNTGPKTYPELKQHFDTLDLAETVPHALIKRQYRRLCLECHPDKLSPDASQTDRDAANERFRQINVAYDAIKDRLRIKA